MEDAAENHARQPPWTLGDIKAQLLDGGETLKSVKR